MFAPFTTDRAALSPDGKRVAYTLHKDDTVYVIIMEVDRPEARITAAIGKDRARVKTADGEVKSEVESLDPDSANFLSDEKTPATVPFLIWSSANRLIISNDVPEIVALDADGQHPGKLVDPDDVNVMLPSDINPEHPQRGSPFVRRAPKVLEVLPDDPDHILIAAEGNVPAAPPPMSTPPEFAVSVFRADVHTGKLKSLHEENFQPDTQVLYDKDGRARLTFPTTTRRQDYDYFGVNGPGGVFTKFAGAELAPSLYRSPENYLAERTFPVAFDYDPNVLYLASNVGRDTLGLYAFDLTTKKRTALGPENFGFDAADLDGGITAQQLVFDRYRKKLAGIRLTGLIPSTYWLDPELTKIQRDLDYTFPSRFTQILGWDEARARFLVQVSSCSDPSRFFIFFREGSRALEFVRLVPDLDLDSVSPTKPFEFDTPEHIHLTGYLTQPADPRVNPPPLALYCHDLLLSRSLPSFNRDVQALAAMGFIVAQVNYRGSAGFGRAHRETFTTGISNGSDRAPIDDMVATIEWVDARQKIDRKRIALFGSGYGGTLALRALELEPERFRCAVTIDAPTDLQSWLNQADLRQMDRDRASMGPGADSAVPGITLGPSLGKAPPLPPPVDFFPSCGVTFSTARDLISTSSPPRATPS